MSFFPLDREGGIVEVSEQTAIIDTNVLVVDALLLEWANKISCHCDLEPAIRTASFDARDLTKCLRARRHRFRIWDLEAEEVYP